MTTSGQLAAGISNPFTDLPVLGGVVELVDGLLADLGIPLWMAEAMELCGLLLLLYVFLLQVIRKVLPWLATVLKPFATWLFDHIAMILLLPELITTRVRAKMGKHPLAFAYTYGDGVLSLTRIATSFAGVVLEVLPRVRQTPRVVLIGVAVLFALAWNKQTCVFAEVSSTCVSPATSWIEETGEWFEKTGR